jgi:tellurite resistance protein
MFLGKLNEEEKKLFLNLAVKVAEANGIVAEAEKNMINQYCLEMGLSVTQKNNKSIDEAIDGFSKSSVEIKRIVMIELIGLCMSDEKYETEERSIIEKIAQALDISNETIELFEADLKNYRLVVKSIAEHVFK